jgi:hypothetical protein
MSSYLSSTPPKFHGEFRVYQQLLSFDDEDLFFWSSLDFIPNVNDIDLLVWHKKEGVFVLEIKAITLDMILEFSFNSCEIKGRGNDRSPQNQAYDALQSLRNFLSPQINKVPFMVSSVVWPLITRSEWKASFKASSEIANLADSMIMMDDIFTAPSIFVERLRKIWKSPPQRRGSDFEFKNDNEVFHTFASCLNPKASPIQVFSDRQKLINLEKGIKKDLFRDFPPYLSGTTIFKGQPGTGKTYRLLQIGIMHSRENAKVLFCCFNQVLASDIQRILNILDLTLKADGDSFSIKENIQVLDISTLLNKVCEELGIEYPKDEFDVWGNIISEELNKNLAFLTYPKYDTILIDECQDFKEWQLNCAKSMGNHDCQYVIGFGQSQDLYNEKSDLFLEYIKEVFQHSDTRTLRRNFRNSKKIYQLAELILEANFDSSKIPAIYLKRFKKKKKPENDEIIFDIDNENIAAINYINDDINYDSSNYLFELNDLMVNQYEELISSELLRLGDNNPIDLLILVPETNRDEVIWVRQALERIESNTKIGYLDYVATTNRKLIAPANKIRLVTFHSSRGLEATNVLILGIEKLKMFKESANRLGFITSSRAILNLTFCSRSSRKNHINQFIEDSILFLSKSNE